MSALAPFGFEGRELHVITVDGQPWFVAGMVSDTLGYSATAAMTRTLDEDEKGVHTLHTLGGPQSVTVISEAGLYSAILRSRVEGAKRFKRWVTHEVLPTIRTTGSYSATPALPASYADALRELASTVEAKELAVQRAEVAEAQVIEAAPKVEAFDAFMDADGYYSMAGAARMLGFGRTTFFRKLREERILQKAQNLPYREYDRYFFMKPGVRPDGEGGSVATLTPKLRPEAIDWLRKRLRAQVLPSGLVALAGGA